MAGAECRRATGADELRKVVEWERRKKQEVGQRLDVIEDRPIRTK